MKKGRTPVYCGVKWRESQWIPVVQILTLHPSFLLQSVAINLLNIVLALDSSPNPLAARRLVKRSYFTVSLRTNPVATIPTAIAPPPAVKEPSTNKENVSHDPRLEPQSDRSAIIGFLVSMISHISIILILALLVFAGDKIGNGGFTVFMGDPNESGTEEFQVESASASDLPSEDLPTQELSSISVSEIATTEPILFEPTKVESQQTSPTNIISQIQTSVATGSTSGMFKGMGLESRKGANRQQGVAKRGGTPGSEQAVEAALAWLVAHQAGDGGWSLHLDDEPCNGRCRDSSNHNDPERAAATGMALLCFLGAGYTHQDGPYQQQVKDGLYFLMQYMKRTPQGGRFPDLNARFAMYEQGIATLAMCEAYQMTKDEALKETCQLAVNYISYAQHTDGGWGYDPRIPGDISIACWQVVALKSALSANLQVPLDSIKQFDKFLDNCQAEGGSKYRYRQLGPEPGPTAMGLLMRMYRGWLQSEPKLIRGLEYLLREGPSQEDVYYNYYATQVFFQQESAMWDRWNPLMRDYLVSSQSVLGHEKGSWYFDGNRHNEVGGRLYCTAMCCMTLEVYYRHMPIYGHIKVEDFEL